MYIYVWENVKRVCLNEEEGEKFFHLDETILKQIEQKPSDSFTISVNSLDDHVHPMLVIYSKVRKSRFPRYLIAESSLCTYCIYTLARVSWRRSLCHIIYSTAGFFFFHVSPRKIRLRWFARRFRVGFESDELSLSRLDIVKFIAHSVYNNIYTTFWVYIGWQV